MPPAALGREAELRTLHGWLAQAQGGACCVGLVTGEAGIGKTTLVDAFVAQAAATGPLWLARGQCIEHYGAGEAYLPVLDALGQLCRGLEAAQVLALLAQHAPLWLVQLVDALLRQGALVAEAGSWELPGGLEALEATVPESLRALIEQQFDGLRADEQRALEAASVVGLDWTVAAVAAGVETEVEQVEAWCAALARQGQFVQAGGLVEWPDGAMSGSYQFRHALYQQVVYDRVPLGQRVRLHQRIGVRLEAGYQEQASAHAAELALHFERGREPARAVHYLRQAGRTPCGGVRIPRPSPSSPRGWRSWPSSPRRRHGRRRSSICSSPWDRR